MAPVDVDVDGAVVGPLDVDDVASAVGLDSVVLVLQTKKSKFLRFAARNPCFYVTYVCLHVTRDAERHENRCSWKRTLTETK
jgi:hypothetical protein